MLRKLILAGAVIALVIGPAAAQMPMPGMSLHNGPKQLTPEEQARQKAIDDAYKAATKKIPDKEVANDPWGNVRSIPPTTNGKRN